METEIKRRQVMQIPMWRMSHESHNYTILFYKNRTCMLKIKKKKLTVERT